ncbi:MAG: hypothetical protein WC796_02210 [Candidatus Pacearchaeota archaeon]|jgi:hypothetical protein
MKDEQKPRKSRNTKKTLDAQLEEGRKIVEDEGHIGLARGFLQGAFYDAWRGDSWEGPTLFGSPGSYFLQNRLDIASKSEGLNGPISKNLMDRLKGLWHDAIKEKGPGNMRMLCYYMFDEINRGFSWKDIKDSLDRARRYAEEIQIKRDLYDSSRRFNFREIEEKAKESYKKSNTDGDYVIIEEYFQSAFVKALKGGRWPEIEQDLEHAQEHAWKVGIPFKVNIDRVKALYRTVYIHGQTSRALSTGNK